MSSAYVTQPLHRLLQHRPQRCATVCGGTRRSYRQLVDRVSRLASALQQLGMRPGDRVGILSPTSDCFLEAYYAIWWGGGVVNPINTRWSMHEVAYSLDHCDTRLLIVDSSFAGKVDELVNRSQSLHVIICTGFRVPSGMFSYEALIDEHAPVADTVRANEDLAGIFYTGGTTGLPKGVMLSHTNLTHGALSLILHGAVLEGDVGLHVAPMFHLADAMFALSLTEQGGTHVMLPGFEPSATLSILESESINAVLLVPTMIQMLVDHPEASRMRLGALRQMIYGASPISESLLGRALDWLPHARFLQAYGQTEMSPVVSILGPQWHESGSRSKLRSAGRAALGTEVRIVDTDGHEVPRGTVGEIIARGPGVMLGYWNDPEQTARSLRNGWVHTGDAAYMDEDGFIYVVDRLKDMIVSGGENVYSAEVENALAQHPAVAACAVIGIPDVHWGEAVHAVVVLKSGVVASVEQLMQHCHTLIAGYKCPRSVEIRASLPTSAAGKVLKTELREPYWKHRSRLVG